MHAPNPIVFYRTSQIDRHALTQIAGEIDTAFDVSEVKTCVVHPEKRRLLLDPDQALAHYLGAIPSNRSLFGNNLASSDSNHWEVKIQIDGTPTLAGDA